MLNHKLRNGLPIIGTWVSLTDPAVVEILCQSDFDFLLLDGEHSPIPEDALKAMLMAAKGSETAIIYRVRQNDEAMIKIALDLGVDGLFVPMVNSAAEAQAAVDATRYAPLGKRGVGPWRASNYFQDMAGYMDNARDTVTLILQIEDQAALPYLDEILAVEGFDAAFIGPADLTSSMGLFPETQHPKVLETIAQINAKCQAAGVPLGVDAASPTQISELRRAGFQIFTYGMDVSYLIEGMTATAKIAREALS